MHQIVIRVILRLFGAFLYEHVEIGDLVYHIDSIIGQKPIGLVVSIIDMSQHMETTKEQRYWVFVWIEASIWGDWIDYWECRTITSDEYTKSS